MGIADYMDDKRLNSLVDELKRLDGELKPLWTELTAKSLEIARQRGHNLYFYREKVPETEDIKLKVEENNVDISPLFELSKEVHPNLYNRYYQKKQRVYEIEEELRGFVKSQERG